MRIYGELASWFHLLTAPEEYVAESAIYLEALQAHTKRPLQTILELGAGGGNNAFHYKKYIKPTLTDLSEEMLAMSRTINPELEHLQGDMRTLRLGRTFDAVFCHDAVAYMTTPQDLSQVMETAFIHLAPGGLALFAPDYTKETFQGGTNHGGNDGKERSLRYLEWVYDRDPSDSIYEVDYALLLREHNGETRVEHDHHQEGLFTTEAWLALLRQAGFEASFIERTLHDDEEHFELKLFLGVRPA